MIDWKCSSIARRKDQADPVLEKYQFVPYISDEVNSTYLLEYLIPKLKRILNVFHFVNPNFAANGSRYCC